MALHLSIRLAAGAAGILGGLLAALGPARADLLFSMQSVTANPGDVNDMFEVDVTNTGTTAVDLAAYSFEIDATSTDITFEQSTTGTVPHAYVFAGNSFVDDFVSGVTSISAPGESLSANDLGEIPASFTTIAQGAEFGMSEVFFDVAPGAASEVLPVDFNISIADSSASDPNGNAIALDFSNGQIPINAVPEPSSAVLLSTALIGWLAARRRDRGARR